MPHKSIMYVQPSDLGKGLKEESYVYRELEIWVEACTVQEINSLSSLVTDHDLHVGINAHRIQFRHNLWTK